MKMAATRSPGFDPGDAFPDLDHFAGAVGKRSERRFDSAAVTAFRNHQIAIVQRAGADPNHGLPRSRRRIRKFHALKVFEAECLDESPGFMHVWLRNWRTGLFPMIYWHLTHLHLMPSLKPIAANTTGEKKIYLLKPRGFCAGVVRAIDVVKIALDLYGPPVYVRKEIVHNKHVVDELRELGAVFVEELYEVPDGGRAIFSAHGVSPEVRREGKERNLAIIDATCPLVTKVHLEAVKFASEGYTIVLIGHKNHDEVIGTLGEAPAKMILVESVEDVDALDSPIRRASPI